jgi:hypothetical protein
MKPIFIHRRSNPVAGPSISIPDGSYEHIVNDPADATCTLEFRSDGTCAVSAGVNPSSVPAWKSGGGSGSDYDISFDNGGSWANLGSNQSITRTRNFIGVNSLTYTVKIRRVSDSLVLDTGSVTLIAEVT